MNLPKSNSESLLGFPWPDSYLFNTSPYTFSNPTQPVLPSENMQLQGTMDFDTGSSDIASNAQPTISLGSNANTAFPFSYSSLLFQQLPLHELQNPNNYRNTNINIFDPSFRFSSGEKNIPTKTSHHQEECIDYHEIPILSENIGYQETQARNALSTHLSSLSAENFLLPPNLTSSSSLSSSPCSSSSLTSSLSINTRTSYLPGFVDHTTTQLMNNVDILNRNQLNLNSASSNILKSNEPLFPQTLLRILNENHCLNKKTNTTDFNTTRFNHDEVTCSSDSNVHPTEFLSQFYNGSYNSCLNSLHDPGTLPFSFPTDLNESIVSNPKFSQMNIDVLSMINRFNVEMENESGTLNSNWTHTGQNLKSSTTMKENWNEESLPVDLQNQLNSLIPLNSFSYSSSINQPHLSSLNCGLSNPLVRISKSSTKPKKKATKSTKPKKAFPSIHSETSFLSSSSKNNFTLTNDREEELETNHDKFFALTPISVVTSSKKSNVKRKKEYPCYWEGCQKTFTTSSHLSRHLRIHLHYKPFACHIEGCIAKFCRPDNLRQHIKTHFKGTSNTSTIVVDDDDERTSPLEKGSQNSEKEKNHKFIEEDTCMDSEINRSPCSVDLKEGNVRCDSKLVRNEGEVNVTDDTNILESNSFTSSPFISVDTDLLIQFLN